MSREELRGKTLARELGYANARDARRYAKAAGILPASRSTEIRARLLRLRRPMESCAISVWRARGEPMAENAHFWPRCHVESRHYQP